MYLHRNANSLSRQENPAQTLCRVLFWAKVAHRIEGGDTVRAYCPCKFPHPPLAIWLIRLLLRYKSGSIIFRYT